MTSLKHYLNLLLALHLLTSCAPGGFSSETDSSEIISKSSTTPPPADSGEDASAIRKKELFDQISNSKMDGYISGAGAYTNEGYPTVDFRKKDGVFIIRALQPNFNPLIIDIAFKDYPGLRLYSDFQTDPRDSTQQLSFLIVEVPAKYIFKSIQQVPAKLPSGDRVPLFPSGEPPSQGILLTPNKDRKAYLYLSGEAFGLFIETSFNPKPIPLVELIYPIRSKDRRTIGYLTLVEEKSGFKGGLFFSHRIDPKIGKAIEEYYLN